jgi:hypothetical protein
MKIVGYPVDLMVDTGMTHSVVTQPVGPLSQRNATIVRATGDQTQTCQDSVKYLKGDSLTWEEKVLNMDKKSGITGRCMGP